MPSLLRRVACWEGAVPAASLVSAPTFAPASAPVPVPTIPAPALTPIPSHSYSTPASAPAPSPVHVPIRAFTSGL